MSRFSRGRAGLPVVVLVVAGLFLMALLVACGSSPSEPTPDGAQLLETRCSVCHTLDRVTQATKTAGEWEQTVDRMIANGAELDDAEKTAVVDYLAENYGP